MRIGGGPWAAPIPVGARMGAPGTVARYLLIDVTNAVISRMLLGGPGPDGSDPNFETQGGIFFEADGSASSCGSPRGDAGRSREPRKRAGSARAMEHHVVVA